MGNCCLPALPPARRPARTVKKVRVTEQPPPADDEVEATVVGGADEVLQGTPIRSSSRRELFKEMDTQPFRGHPFAGLDRRELLPPKFEDLTRDMFKPLSFPDWPASKGPKFGDLTRDMLEKGFTLTSEWPKNMKSGQYVCQTYSMSSVTGVDGKVYSERYVSSDVGSMEHKVRDVKRAYSNSSGIDQLGRERWAGDRGWRRVQERDNRAGTEKTTDTFRGMSEHDRQAFDRDFREQMPLLPEAPRFSVGPRGIEISTRGREVAKLPHEDGSWPHDGFFHGKRPALRA